MKKLLQILVVIGALIIGFNIGLIIMSSFMNECKKELENLKEEIIEKSEWGY